MPLCSHRLEDPSFSGKYRRYIVIVLQKKGGKYRKVYRDKYGKANQQDDSAAFEMRSVA